MLLPNRHSPWVRVAFMAGAVGLFFAGYQWGNRWQLEHAAPPAIRGVLVRPPAAIPGFTLKDPRGRVFDGATLAAGWTLLAFGDLSTAQGQLAVSRLIDVYNRVSDREPLHRELRLVLASAADTPNLARDFAALSPALYVVGGEPSEIGRLRDSLGAGAPAGPGTESGPPVFVFTPGGFLVALLPGSEDAAAMAADLVALHEGIHLLVKEPG
jgi:hypothetical protein